ncbi:hypothetical protein [Mucilaginibacter sp. UYCu711]|uniref:hypothetical protein n=1 Tax=Mucilaginibacter sp. UYCu711 TaxID=3156339 RepID=UPI003D198D47
MRKSYLMCVTALSAVLFSTLFIASCKKDPQVNPIVTEPSNLARLGLYEQISGINRRIFIACSKLGDQATVNYGLVFDTGSTGLTIDANGIIPASMITTNGFVIPGDSVVVNGITITSQQAVITYGSVNSSISEYGNLAYTAVTIGDGNGNITTPRIPIFLYYKIVDNTGKQLSAHAADVFGVGPGVSSTSRKIGSPLSYFKLADNVASGFRLAKLNSSNFGNSATYTPNLLTIGLTPNDLNASSFVMHPLAFNAISGYSSNIASTITYNNKNVAGKILFDTGTPSTHIIEDPTATTNTAALPANTTVSFVTGPGFSYQFATASNYNFTTVQKPSYSGDDRTILSINFFLDNEFLVDYTNHRIGLKN